MPNLLWIKSQCWKSRLNAMDMALELDDINPRPWKLYCFIQHSISLKMLELGNKILDTQNYSNTWFLWNIFLYHPRRKRPKPVKCEYVVKYLSIPITILLRPANNIFLILYYRKQIYLQGSPLSISIENKTWHKLNLTVSKGIST